MKRFVLLFLALVLLCCSQRTHLSAEAKKAKEPEKKAPAMKPVVINDELFNADLKDKVYQQSYCKTYTIKLEKGRAYQIEMASNTLRPVLRLENSGGTAVASTQDQGNQRATIFYEPTTTEDFHIIATTPNDARTGKYTLTVRDATGFMILSVNDKLNQNDKQYAGAGNKKHKLFLAQLEAGKTYQIDMKSGAFDSYLFLESPDGKKLTQDDDGGGYPSARIIWKATETGKFRIITTYFGGGGNLGDFTLTVRQTDGDPPVMIDKKDDKK